MRRVYLVWLDAHVGGSTDSTWMPISEAVTSELATVQQVGWILSEYDDRIVIASSLQGEYCCDVNSIPKVCISKMEDI